MGSCEFQWSPLEFDQEHFYVRYKKDDVIQGFLQYCSDWLWVGIIYLPDAVLFSPQTLEVDLTDSTASTYGTLTKKSVINIDWV